MSKLSLFSPMADQRRAGILLHPTSLPGGSGNGDMGPEAYHFIDFLVSCGASVWQILPLGPTHEDGSPYMGLSVLAGNPQLISLQLLIELDWLEEGQLVDGESKHQHLIKAWHRFKHNGAVKYKQAFDEFKDKHGFWLKDFALFQVIRKQNNGLSWVDWPQPLRDKDEGAIDTLLKSCADEIDQIFFEQFVFFKQWLSLKQYANQRNILIVGDMPIFVAHDSAEVWAHREYFDLKKDGHARTIAGVPPDYFSKTGQRWGNPHYNWKRMRADDFKWWHERIHGSLELCDMLRVDHFRGFEAYWQISADAETAMEGKWVKAPGKALFKTLLKSFDQLPFIAEDLGTITDEVHQLREKFSWPGMKILQFAFDGNPENLYLPHNHAENSVAYTGTHDNDTTLSWFNSLSDHDKRQVYTYFGHTTEEMPWLLIRAAFASTANLAVVPMQDVLSLGHGHRMNTPGESEGNWSWRFEWSQVNDDTVARMKHMVQLYGREIHTD